MKINIGKLKPESELHEHNLEQLFKEEIDPYWDPNEDEEKFGITMMHYGNNRFNQCYFWGAGEGEEPKKLQNYVVNKILPEVMFKGFMKDCDGQFNLTKEVFNIFLQAAKDLGLDKSGSDYTYIIIDSPEAIIKFGNKVRELLNKAVKTPKKAVASNNKKLPPKKVAAKAVVTKAKAVATKKIVVKDLKPPTVRKGK